MVSTLVGIAPYIPMLNELAARNDGTTEVHFLYGIRGQEDYVLQAQLEGFAAEYPWFKLAVCCSRNKPDSPFTISGYVTAALQQLEPSPETDHVLLCGNPQMIDNAYDALKQQGFKPRQVTREKYVFAKEVKGSTPVLSEEQKALIQAKLKQHK